MNRLTKGLIKFSILFSFCIFFIFINPTKVYAWEAHLNENGDIEIYTVDKKKTSNIWYESIGVSVTRCVYDPAQKQIHESQEYFTWALDMPVEDLINGVYYCTFTIPLSDVIANAGGAWAEEITNAVNGTGPACYIKLDCLMVTYDDNNHIKLGPYVNAPGVYGGDGNLETGIRADGVQIKNAYGWANPNGLRTHYNHYLLIGTGVEELPQAVAGEFVTYDYTMDHYAGIDANQPTFAMSNYSSQFDLSQGIPSSEYIDNAFLADSWFGNTNVYASIIGKPYTWDIRYYWLVPDGHWDFIDTDNDLIPDTRKWIDTSYLDGETYSIPIGTAYIAYQFLSDTHIYDFTNADIANGAYDGDHVYYDDTNEVPMTCISTIKYTDVGTSVGTLMREEPNWNSDPEAHVVFAQGINYATSKYLAGGRGDVASEIIKDRDAIRAQISSRTRTRNDKLVIDGHEFMNNNWIIGCDFLDDAPVTYRQCVKSSGWQKDYMLKSGVRPLHEFDPANVTGNVTVQIPPTVDNGYYYTSMKVYYQRLVTYAKTVKEFFAGE